MPPFPVLSSLPFIRPFPGELLTVALPPISVPRSCFPLVPFVVITMFAVVIAIVMVTIIAVVILRQPRLDIQQSSRKQKSYHSFSHSCYPFPPTYR
jgi:hypothetical protein